MILINIFLFLFVSAHLFAYERIFDVCAIFKNESRFLAEWIDYHRVVGAEHFWLYNNNSEDDYKKILQPYIDKDIVHLIEWPSVHEENDWYNHSFTVQTGAYSDCLLKERDQCKWLALIDIDEFIVPMCADYIPEILETYFSDVSGLCINWLIFGTSWIDEIQPGELLIEKLILRAPLSHERNLIYKSIVQPSHTTGCSNPHLCLYTPNHWHVNTKREKVGDVASHSVLIDKLRIHHYWAKDEKFFREQKIPRYLRWGAKEEDLILEKETQNSEKDLEMQRFVEKVKALKKTIN